AAEIGIVGCLRLRCSGGNIVGAHHASCASLRPVNCQRAAGGKKLRYVGRVWPSGVAWLPPRSTSWPTMNLPLYSPTAPANGRKPGYGSYEERVHCQPSPVICVMPGNGYAASHSNSV